MIEMDAIQAQLGWIDGQVERMVGLVLAWANINTGSGNLVGLSRLADELIREFGPLGAVASRVTLPSYLRLGSDGRLTQAEAGDALLFVQRPEATPRVLLCIHTDTVYPPEGQSLPATRTGRTLHGPGVADAKGGIAVMLIALESLERSGLSLGWDVLLNPDEEIGSPASADLLTDAARRNDFGLLFEPALDGGALVSARRGSGNFSIVVRGKAAHAGRDFDRGRNAVVAAANLATRVHRLNAGSVGSGVTVNVARIEGGSPLNVVPDLAIVRLNARAVGPEQAAWIEKSLADAVEKTARHEGISVELHGGFHCPPKPLDPPTLTLLEHIAACGAELGLHLTWRESGGASDGNKLAAAGLPNVDSLGVRGGAIHSPDEYALADSLPERAKLTALLLMRLAAGDLRWTES